MGDIHADTRIKNSDKKVIGNHELEIKITRNYKILKKIIINDEIYPGLLSATPEVIASHFGDEIKIHSFENNAESILNDEAMIYYLFRVDLKIAGFCALMLLNDEKNYVVDIGIYKKF